MDLGDWLGASQIFRDLPIAAAQTKLCFGAVSAIARRKNIGKVCVVFVAGIVLWLSVPAGARTAADAVASPAPIPPAVLHARTAFVANAGADAGLFPHPFSGDESRGYAEFYNRLREAQEYELVTDPSQADLVMELRLHAPYGPKDVDKSKGSADPLPSFRLVIYDGKSHYVLWAMTEPIALAVKQQTHDRNFDEAISNLISDLRVLRQMALEQSH